MKCRNGIKTANLKFLIKKKVSFPANNDNLK